MSDNDNIATDISERTRLREEELRRQISGSRRLALPTDYVFDKQQEEFWDLRDGTLHTEKAVDASIPIEHWRVQVDEGEEPAAEGARPRGRPRRRRERLIPPSRDIMRVELDQFVEGSTWWPGEDLIIKDIFIDNNGWRKAVGRRIYNKYIPPPDLMGDPKKATPWLDHVKKLWPDPKEHEYFFDYVAHMIQFPMIKCNAAIVMSGAQRIGKDAALAPLKTAIGMWNSKNIDPDDLFSQYRPWVETLMLTVDEVRPSKDDFHASSAYNILKPMIAAPPDTLGCNDKYTKMRHVINRMRVFITTNDWMSMYIPPEDGRMFIMHSDLKTMWHKAEGKEDYFTDLFAWFDAEGAGHIAAWLKKRDLSKFNPKGEVLKTRGWEVISSSWGEPEDCIAAALDRLNKPPVVFGQELSDSQFDHAEELAGMLKSPRKIAHRMLKAGYAQVACKEADRWLFSSGGATIKARYAFVRTELAASSTEAARLVREHGKKLVEAKAAKI